MVTDISSVSERLEKELIRLLPASISEGIKVVPPPYGVDSAWHGAKIVSNVSEKHLLILLVYFKNYLFLLAILRYSFT